MRSKSKKLQSFLLDPLLLGVELVEQVLVHSLGLGRVQHVEGDPVLRWVAVKQVGLHPGSVLNDKRRNLLYLLIITTLLKYLFKTTD